jgi:hypothetical protein
VINNNTVVEVTNNVDVVAGDIVINNNATGITTATLDILTNGALSVVGNITVGQSTNSLVNTNTGLLTVQGGTLGITTNIVIRQNGTVNITGGSVTAGRISTATNSPGQTASGTLNISGGTVTVTNGNNALLTPALLCNGTVNLTGGTLVLSDPTPGGTTFSPVIMNSNAVALNNAAFNLSGGNLVIAGAAGATDVIQVAGKFNLNS